VSIISDHEDSLFVSRSLIDLLTTDNEPTASETDALVEYINNLNPPSKNEDARVNELRNEIKEIRRSLKSVGISGLQDLFEIIEKSLSAASTRYNREYLSFRGLDDEGLIKALAQRYRDNGALLSRRDEWTSSRKIRIKTVSWNVDGRHETSPIVLHPALKHAESDSPDIWVIGYFDLHAPSRKGHN
jgi:hypothetical protein